MKFLVKLYNTVVAWSKHSHAPYYLSFLSFIDSSVFPISPLVMLIPMSFAAPHRAFLYAAITSVSSIFGGIIGYLLGYFAFKTIVHPLLELMGYLAAYQSALDAFNHWGYWAIFVGCFSPFIPYKIFTIGAGVMQLNLGLFLVASAFGRALRFFIIAGIIYWGGPRLKPILNRTLARLGYTN